MLETIENYIQTFKEKEHLYVKKNVSIIGSPLGAGQSLEGVKLACDDLRKLGLHNVIKFMGWNYEDIGNIETNTTKNKSKEEEENTKMNNTINKKHASKEILNGYNDIIDEHMNKKYLGNDYYNNIKNVELIGRFNERLFHVMSNELKKKNFVLNIGGDHSIAFASVLSSLHIYKDLKVIWIDAHGDINTPETSPSGNYHGMPLAHSLGLFKKKVPYFEWSETLTYLKAENLAMIGIRDIDMYEKIILKKYNINYYTIFDVEQNGIYNTISNALKRIDPSEKCPIHISLDIDSVDNIFAPGTGTIAKGGLTYREINLLMKILADTKRVVSMDLVEYDPLLDEQEKKFHGDSLPISKSATKTGKLCLELIARILGYDIV
ncbi:arginase, putative [Plasmodium relictum]|uniref:Arginase, putative n=1 Tax=Plasmodium relictum TaxID=85471 RepID=A0A1J1H2Y4_PLARL|nr:arginase, putative [Plasmodium relictum]CRG99274.1 arginase, putative [Plasmodium relictum]